MILIDKDLLDNYIVDFYCKDLQLAIEIDGVSHTFEVNAENDIIRQKRLEELGMRFLRFDDIDVKQELEFVLNRIHDWIIENTHP